MVFHGRLLLNRNRELNASHLCYASKKYMQYQVAVKLLGSFRLTAGNRHLHRYCIFTEQVPETVAHSLHYSCTSELTRQGISLFDNVTIHQFLKINGGKVISALLSLSPVRTDY